jgi:hypothetical protein
MRNIRIFTALLLLITLASFSANAQCKGFAKKEVLPLLTPYTHDGNYHAAVLVEGEEAELYKTFYSDMEYRVVVAGEEKLPSIEFQILDENRNILYTNKDHNYARFTDLKLENSKQLRLVIKVNSFNKSGEIPATGCVAIMFGFRMKK